ncbi:MAG TPA: CPBP family intramembrane glutamic endopeptidase [Solirubrobacteraceae bacterium]|nr:CPBP family intramembrane glutamic endopeptidase [Solirubrobacteraceae bacterium]
MNSSGDPFGRAMRAERAAMRDLAVAVPSAPSQRGPVGLPPNDWPAWSGPVALVAALVLAAVGGLIVDIPAVLAGVKVSSGHTPGGLELADTVVQDAMFVLTAVLFAQMGGRVVRSRQLGLRPTRARWWRIALAVLGVYVAFFIFSAIWAAALGEEPKEELLKALGANETTLLLALSALLTTVIAPIGEETLFRGYIFPALAKWRGWTLGAVITGVLFGAVHVGSAPVVYLVPLAVLGFLLCALYRQTGSLYPCIATHCLNNSIAFGALEKWSWWQIALLAIGALSTIGLLGLALRRLGVISAAPDQPNAPASAYDPGNG